MLKDKTSPIIHDKAKKEFILMVNDEKSFITYTLKGETMYLTHAEVPLALRGKRVGKNMVEQTFEYIEKHNIQAVAVCVYVKRIRERSPKWSNLIG